MAVAPYSKIDTPNADKISADTLCLYIAGVDDIIVRPSTVLSQYNKAYLPKNAGNNNYILVGSDAYNDFSLSSDHSAFTGYSENYSAYNLGNKDPGPRSYIDALDWYDYWKLFDGLTDAAFYGKNRDYALGNTYQQKFLGIWPNGNPVKELEITQY